MLKFFMLATSSVILGIIGHLNFEKSAEETNMFEEKTTGAVTCRPKDLTTIL
jgi:hypothetical protein